MVLRGFVSSGETAVTADAFAERNATDLSAEVVAPLVVRARDRLRVTGPGRAELRAAMPATIDDHVDRVALVAGDQHRGIADEAAYVVAWVGDLRGERDVIPRPPAKDALLLSRVDAGIHVELVGNAAGSFHRPCVRCTFGRHGARRASRSRRAARTSRACGSA